jgi:hypothetical protein
MSENPSAKVSVYPTQSDGVFRSRYTSVLQSDPTSIRSRDVIHELDTWAYLMRPPEMTKLGVRRSNGTGGALSDLHDDASIVMWRFLT